RRAAAERRNTSRRSAGGSTPSDCSNTQASSTSFPSACAMRRSLARTSCAARERSISSRVLPTPRRQRSRNRSASSTARARLSADSSSSTRRVPSRRARTCSGVNTGSPIRGVIAAPLARERLAGALRDELVKNRAFVPALTQDAAEPLHVLPHRPTAADHDGDARVRHVDAFVQHLGRDDGAVLPLREALQDLAPLLHLRLMRDHGKEKAPRDGVRRRVVLSEDQRLLVAVLIEQPIDHGELGGGGERELALPEVGLKGTPSGVGARGAPHEILPSVPPVHANPLRAQEVDVDLALPFVFVSLFAAQLDLDADRVVVGEVGAGELDDVFSVDERPDESLEQRIATILPLRSLLQPQPERRQAELCREPVRLSQKFVPCGVDVLL